jgi:Outer membrane protein beta-barrel domain
MNKTAAYCWLLALATSFASTAALADLPLGVYVGAAVGQSLVTSGDKTAADFVPLRSDHHFGAWKAFVGARPLSMLGIELAYIDFGNASASPSSSTIFGYFKDNLKQSATALFGIGYLPLPVPFLDLYGKVGVARLHSDAQESYLPPSCPVGVDCTIPYTVRQNQSNTNLAYGAGAQARFGSVSVRAEYERISASGGSPELLSLGVTWNF